MPRVRTVRPFVCLLLAVSTAGGTVLTPYRACACTAHRTDPTGRPVVTASRVGTAPPACCQCCPSGAVKADCCCREASTTSAGRAGDTNPSGCACARCEGDHPVRMPDAPPPNGGVVADHLADLAAALATPSAVPFPPEPNRSDRLPHVTSPTPTDLVLVLSRRTI